VVVDLEASTTMNDLSHQLDVVHALAPARRTIGIRRLSRSTLLGFAAGAAAGALLIGAARLFGFGPVLLVGIAPAVAGIVAGAVVGILRWPRALEAARAADRHFSLHDRLTTALELRSSELPLAALQRRDAALRIEGLRLGRIRGRWLGRRDGVAVALAAMAFAAALALGSPGQTQHAAVAAPSDTSVVRRAAATQVKQLSSKLKAGLTPTLQHSIELHQLDRVLTRLRRQLLHAASRRAALRAISATQQQLARLAALGLHPINAKAVAQLNGSLGRYLGKEQANKASASANARALAAAQVLTRLAQSLAHLSAAQRAALAQALARAANATSNNTLRSSLRQAASALANSDPQTASLALQHAVQALSQSPQQQAALSRFQQAGNQLDSLKNQLSGVAGTIPSNQPAGQPSNSPAGVRAGNGQSGTGPSQTRANAGRSYSLGPKPGSGKGKGQGTGYSFGTRRGQGQGRGSGFARSGRAGGKGQGTSQSGSGAGRGQAAYGHEGSAASPGRTTAGAHGTGGRGRTSRTRSGHSATVYIPAPQGKGKQIIQNGPNGAPQPGAVVPYQQVIGTYSQSAHQALDRSALPPSLQGYVRKYFSAISR
jgi:hypothetical protein